MPFTFSHPALVIPLLYARRRYQWVSATGLIIGSMAPDCEKFLRLKLASTHSHTPASIFYFSCPVALGLAFVFHLLMRRPLVAHLPRPLYRRLSKYAAFDWVSYFRRYYWGVLLSILLGAALHLFWDSFTHPHPVTSTLLPALTGVLLLGHRAIPIFYVVAAVSSVVGGALIGWAIWKMPVSYKQASPTTANVLRYWGMAALIAVVLEVQWVLMMEPRLLNAGISAISAGFLGVLVTSIYTNRRLTSKG